MYLAILLFGLILLLIYIYLKWLSMKNFWSNKGVTQGPVHPIYGSLSFLQRKNPNVWLKEIYEKYKAPYIGIWLFWRPCLVVNCPEISRRVLVKDADVFRNRYISSGKSDPMGSLNLFTVDDPIWSSVRKRLTSVFTSAKLRGHKQLFENKNRDLVYRIHLENERGNKISLRSLFADYTTDVIGESSFGIKCEATRLTTGPLREMTKVFEEYNTWRGLCWSSIFFLPQMVDIFRFSLWPKDTVEYFRKVYKQMLAERGGYAAPTDGKRDLLDVLIKMKQDSMKDNQDIHEDVVISNAMVFLQGGYDTSSLTSSYTLYELAFNPECQQKVYEELKTVDLDEEQLSKLPYLNAVIKESLRKFPVMGWLDRVALQDYQINKDLTIPAGTVVYVNAVGMQKDPQYFPEPQEFRPERWLPENASNITPYSYLPFGDGPRSCIGKRYGMMSVRNSLASILKEFEVKPLPNATTPNQLTVDKKGLFLMPGEVMSVEFKPRYDKIK